MSNSQKLLALEFTCAARSGFGGDSDDGFFDMTINAAGEIVITGFIYSIGGVPIGNGKVLYHSQLPWKTYLVRISPAGVVLDAKFLEKDTSRCEINSIATDGINYYSTGNAYENFTISSTLNCQVQGGTMTPDIFVAKLDSAFNPVWLKVGLFRETPVRITLKTCLVFHFQCLANAGDDRSYSVAVKGSDIYIGGLLRLNGASKTFGPSTVKGASDDKPDGVYAKLSASTGAIIWVKLVSGNPNYDYVFHVEIGKVGVYITGATTGNYTVGGKLAPYEDGTDFTYNGQCGYVARISPTDGSILAIAFGPATKGYSEQRVTKEVPDGTLFTLGYRDEYQAKNLSITVGADTKFAANATGGDSFLIRYLNNLQPVTPV